MATRRLPTRPGEDAGAKNRTPRRDRTDESAPTPAGAQTGRTGAQFTPGAHGVRRRLTSDTLANLHKVREAVMHGRRFDVSSEELLRQAREDDAASPASRT